MAISERLQQFLKDAGVRHTVATHPVAYTAQEIAAAQHVPGRQLAKSVLVLTDRGPLLAVLPAIQRVDLPKLKQLLKATKLSIASEADIRKLFPDVEVGAMSPFGNLYNVPVLMDKTLTEAGEIAFNAGSHTETITMSCADVAKLLQPTVGTFGRSIAPPAKPRRTPAKRSAKRTAKRTAARKSAARRPAPRARTRRRSPR